MDDKIEAEKNMDDFMLPGFRFHPTDEELVGFYLKRKLQHRSLPIELIKQLDIYKYDPWDLPKLASTGEKEWYFYCPRDRKYRNSTRPNRVTGSGFWKATGTDRPIYSSDGAKCIGLKKSLVFYRGRAAKGIKTDWMMHEFRLPTTTDGAPPPKRIMDKSLPASDSWAICRIFKKTNSLAQRALSHSWAASLNETTTSADAFAYSTQQSQFNSETITETDLQNPHFTSFIPSYRTMFTKPPVYTSSHVDYFPESLFLSPRQEVSATTNKSGTSTVDLSSMLFNISPAYEGPQMNLNSYSSFSSPILMQQEDEQEGSRKNQNTWGNIRSMGFPFSLPSSAVVPNVPWDSPPDCPSEISSTAYSTDKCYT